MYRKTLGFPYVVAYIRGFAGKPKQTPRATPPNPFSPTVSDGLLGEIQIPALRPSPNLQV